MNDFVVDENGLLTGDDGVLDHDDVLLVVHEKAPLDHLLGVGNLLTNVLTDDTTREKDDGSRAGTLHTLCKHPLRP